MFECKDNSDQVNNQMNSVSFEDSENSVLPIGFGSVLKNVESPFIIKDSSPNISGGFLIDYFPNSVEQKKVFRKIYNATSYILKVLVAKMHLRRSELCRALILIERAIMLSKGDKIMRLTGDNSSMGLVVSILLSQKCSSDHSYSNLFFSRLFEIPLNNLAESELFFLEVLNFNLCISEEDFKNAEDLFVLLDKEMKELPNNS